eukprot:1506957-Amphidinium_carterae.1
MPLPFTVSFGATLSLSIYSLLSFLVVMGRTPGAKNKAVAKATADGGRGGRGRGRGGRGGGRGGRGGGRGSGTHFRGSSGSAPGGSRAPPGHSW